jgi:hypothetical protein
MDNGSVDVGIERSRVRGKISAVGESDKADLVVRIRHLFHVSG